MILQGCIGVASHTTTAQVIYTVPAAAQFIPTKLIIYSATMNDFIVAAGDVETSGSSFTKESIIGEVESLAPQYDYFYPDEKDGSGRYVVNPTQNVSIGYSNPGFLTGGFCYYLSGLLLNRS